MASATFDLIFCGNPGAGKSTLLSSISGQQFDSGISFGHGLTTTLQWKTSPLLPGIRFGDTPGLSDTDLKKKAAEAITGALKDAASKKREVRIVFVVTLEAGRVRLGDVMTIKDVMASIRVQGNQPPPHLNSFAVIINKCGMLKEQQFLEKGKSAIEATLGSAKIMCSPFITGFVKFLPEEMSLRGQSNKTANFPGLLDWILVCNPVAVTFAEAINTESREQALEAHKEAYEEQIANLEAQSKEKLKKYKDELDVTKHAVLQLEKQNVALSDQHKQQVQQYEAQVTQLQKELERDRAQHHADMSRMHRESDFNLARLEAEQQDRWQQCAQQMRDMEYDFEMEMMEIKGKGKGKGKGKDKDKSKDKGKYEDIIDMCVDFKGMAKGKKGQNLYNSYDCMLIDHWNGKFMGSKNGKGMSGKTAYWFCNVVAKNMCEDFCKGKAKGSPADFYWDHACEVLDM